MPPGKARTIQVEVRKKRVFVKREASAGEVAEAAPPAPSVDAGELALREEEARKQAELISRQAAEAAVKAEREKKRKPARGTPGTAGQAEAAQPAVEAKTEQPAEAQGRGARCTGRGKACGRYAAQARHEAGHDGRQESAEEGRPRHRVAR